MDDTLLVKFTNTALEAVTPSRGREGDAGYDLSSIEDVVLQPFERKLIGTGIAIELPASYAALILPRSGNAIKKGLSLVNTPGLIDSNYRGELKVIAINLDPKEPIKISKGDRIAQLITIKVENVNFTEVGSLEDSNRGANGFGSSGQ